VRELAFMARRGQRIALGKALNEHQGDWLTSEHCDYVLQLVARRLRVSTLTPGQYRAERAAMLAADRRRRAHGGQLRLPTEDQIAAIAGSWDRALANAGLRARQGRGGQRARTTPATIVHILERCYEQHGTEPTVSEIEAFARANGIPYPRRQRGRPWFSYVEEWKDGRRAKGLDVPDGPPPKAQRPDSSSDVGAGHAGERRMKNTSGELHDCAEWVARYLSQLKAGERSSQRGYADWARITDGAPWPAAFTQHGGWVAVRDAAQKLLRSRQR
jgi:hypothetical protein